MKTGIEQVAAIAAAKSGNPRSCGQTEVAKVCGVSPQAVQRWLKQGWVPTARCRDLEKEYGVAAIYLMDPRHRDALLSMSKVNK